MAARGVNYSSDVGNHWNGWNWLIKCDLLNTFDPISVHGLFKGVVIRICPTFNSKQCFNARWAWPHENRTQGENGLLRGKALATKSLVVSVCIWVVEKVVRELRSVCLAQWSRTYLLLFTPNWKFHELVYFHCSFSKQKYLVDASTVSDLPDGTPCYRTYTNSKNQRFWTPEQSSKNRILYLFIYF